MFNKLINNFYNKEFNKRCDDPGYQKYFTYLDFPNMKETTISFKTKEGITLRGGLYYNKSSIHEYDRLIVFLHGTGGGYLSYMTEISVLVNNGFLVMAYDYEATFSSDGDSLKGFSLPVYDFIYAHKYIKENPDLNNKKLIIMGHSWGGFGALNSATYFDDIKYCVAISAPLSIDSILKGFKLIKPIRNKIIKQEEMIFGDIAKLDGLNIIKKDIKLLTVYSTNDPIVKDKYNYYPLRKLDKNPLHKSIILNDRFHNPTYTYEANLKLHDLIKRINIYLKQNKTKNEIKELLSDINYLEVVNQDMEVWDNIIKFLNN